MGKLLGKILGFAGSGLSDIHFYFLKPDGGFIFAVTGFAAAVLIIYLYLKESRTIPVYYRLILAVLRIAALLLAGFLIFEPVMVVEETSRLRPSFVVLVDNSLSMKLSDNGVNRMQEASRLLSNKQLKLLERLGKENDISVYTFSVFAEQLEQKDGKYPDIQVDRNGFSTAIGDALVKAMNDRLGQPVSGIMLITDGQNTGGLDPEDAAASALKRGIPLFIAGVGDPSVKKDVLVSNIFCVETASKDDVINLTATVESRGYPGIKVPVKLLKKGVPVNEQVVDLGKQNPKSEVSFNLTADETGDIEYTIEIPHQPEEVSYENNAKAVKVKVTEEKTKVLLADGEPRWLYRFLGNAIRRDKNVTLTTLLETADVQQATAGQKRIDYFPATKEQLFDYDILILGDVSSTYLSKKQAELVLKFVEEKGGGFLFIPGAKWRDSRTRIPEIMKLLPVELGVGGAVNKYQFKPRFIGAEEQFVRLEDDDKNNAKAWESLPGFFWTIATGEKKPGAVVVAKFDQEIKAGSGIFLATQRYGNGKSAFISTDELWRWRFRNEDKYFYRFFGQLLRWLKKEAASGDSQFVKLTTDKKRYSGGEKVLINAKITDKNYTYIKDREVNAFTSVNGSAPEPLKLFRISKDAGIFRGELVPVKSGDYEVWVEYPALGQDLRKVNAGFSVEIPNLEYENCELNEALLKKMAEVSGGAYAPAAEAKKLLDKVETRNTKITIKWEKDIKDSPILIMIFAALLGLEWFLRRNKWMM